MKWETTYLSNSTNKSHAHIARGRHGLIDQLTYIYMSKYCDCIQQRNQLKQILIYNLNTIHRTKTNNREKHVKKYYCIIYLVGCNIQY